jgi:hypothetical protein
LKKKTKADKPHKRMSEDYHKQKRLIKKVRIKERRKENEDI